MKTNLTPTSPLTYHDNENIMSELAAYGLARDIATEMEAESDQTGRKVIGFDETAEGYEITDAPAEELVEYNIGLSIVAGDSELNLIARKDNADSIHKMDKKTLRATLSRILDSV